MIDASLFVLPEPPPRFRSLSRGLAQAYPARPVRIIVGYAAGGGTDITARVIGQWLSERLGQQFVVENRPGAATNIATEAVARAAPDGYTLLLITAANTINATYYDKLNFDFIQDIAPVGAIMRVPLVLVVNPSLPVKTVRELVDHCKANPRKLNFASGGAGGPDHMAGEYFKLTTGVEIEHVAYRGLSPALTDLLGNQIRIGVRHHAVGDRIHQSRQAASAGGNHGGALGSAAGPANRGRRAGRLRGEPMVCVGAPKATPPRVITTLNKEILGGAGDSESENKAGRPWRRADADDARRVRQIHHR